MNEKAEQLWRNVVANDVLVPPTEEEYRSLRARMNDITTRLLLWEGSDGAVKMPTIGEVCLLAEAIAGYNVRVHMADLISDGGPDPIFTVDLP